MTEVQIQIETARLVLRPPSINDLEAWSVMMADEEGTRFIGGPLGRLGAWASLSLMAGAWALSGFANFSVLDKKTGQWIGRAGPWMPAGWPGAEIGWAFDRKSWGHGYAREAAEASIEWARDVLGWREIIHIIHPENERSIALAEALGSSFQDRLPVGAIDNQSPLLIFGQSI